MCGAASGAPFEPRNIFPVMEKGQGAAGGNDESQAEQKPAVALDFNPEHKKVAAQGSGHDAQAHEGSEPGGFGNQQ